MSSERARALREAGEKFDREEAAAKEREAAPIARAAAMLAHSNPAGARIAARLLATDPNPKVRAMAAAKLTNSRPGGSSSLNASSRGGRVANVASKTGASVMARAVEGKATSPGSPSRFAHLAAACDAGAAEIEATAATPQSLYPMSGDMRVAAMRRELAANGGRVPGARSPEDVAAFVAAAAAKARGEKAPVMAATPARAKPDFSTPESTAAFVLAAAAKARGGRQSR